MKLNLLKTSDFLRNTKIRTRLISGFLILSIIPLFITGMISYNSSSKAIASKIDLSNRELMEQLSINIQSILTEYEKVSMEMQMSDEVQKVNFLENYDTLEQNVRKNASIIINEQIEAVQETNSAFKTILSAMDGISEQIDNMGGSVNEITSTEKKTLRIFESVSSVSEQAAATSQEVALSTEEQILAAEELNKHAKDLEKMANQLSKTISQFKL